MKMKTFSKIVAVALTAMMTTCLTSCEEETVPVYGTGNYVDVTTTKSDEPRLVVIDEDVGAFAELEDVHIGVNPPKRYLCVHLTIGNNNGSMTTGELVTVKVTGNKDRSYYPLQYTMGDFDYDKLESTVLEKGYQYTIPFGFDPPDNCGKKATITVIDNYSGKTIGEWTVDVNGINDVDD